MREVRRRSEKVGINKAKLLRYASRVFANGKRSLAIGTTTSAGRESERKEGKERPAIRREGKKK